MIRFDALIQRSAWRNCLENSLRPLSAPLWRQEAAEWELLWLLLTALGAPIRDLSRISKQFRKGNSPKFVLTQFSEVWLKGILKSQCCSLPRVALGYLEEQKYSDQRSPS